MVPKSMLTLIALALLALLVHATPADREPQRSAAGSEIRDRAYWLRRREHFFNKTTFPLTEFNRRLLGGKYTRTREAHLPFWFDYQLFKYVFNKNPAPSPQEELARHHTYISTCMRTLIGRTLFRMLAAVQDPIISSDADQFYTERMQPDNLDRPCEAMVDGAIISVQCQVEFEPNYGNEDPVERAVRLIKQEMAKVESKNQVETYLRAFNGHDITILERTRETFMTAQVVVVIERLTNNLLREQ